MCVTHWQALWRVRLRPGSDDSSKLSACLWARGIFVLILVLLLFQMQASNLGLVVHRVLEMFAFACVDGFYSCLEQIEKKKHYVRNIKALLTRSYVYLLSYCFVSNIQLKHPQGNVDHIHCCSYTWILFHHQR